MKLVKSLRSERIHFLKLGHLHTATEIWLNSDPIKSFKSGQTLVNKLFSAGLISVCSWWLFQGEHTISGHNCCWEVAILESELKYVKSIVHQHTSLTVFSLLLPSSSKTRKSVCQIKQKSLWKLQTKTFSHFWGFLSRRPQFKFIRASTTLYYRTGWENVTNLYFFRYFPSLSKPLTHTVRSLSVQSAECVCADIREEERRHHPGLLCHPHTSINITAFILRGGVRAYMCMCVCDQKHRRNHQADPHHLHLWYNWKDTIKQPMCW